VDSSGAQAVTAALRPVEGKSPSDEHFGELSTALTVLDKTVESNKDTREAAAALADARELARAARQTMNKRRVEVSLSGPVQTATKLLWKVEAKSPVPTDADFEAAEKALAEVEKIVEPIQKPDPAVAEKVKEARSLVKLGRQTLAKRRVEVSLGAPVQTATKLLWKIEAKSPVPTEADFEAAQKALDAVEKIVQPLDKPEPSVAKQVNEAKVLVVVGRKTLAGQGRGAANAKGRDPALRYVRAKPRRPLRRASTPHVLEKTLERSRTTRTPPRPVATRQPCPTPTSAKARIETNTTSRARVHARSGTTASPLRPDFEAATKALADLEKALEPLGKPPASVAVLVKESRSMLKTGRAAVAKRRLELDVEGQKAKVEDARKEAAQLMAALRTADKDGVKATEDSLKKILETLDAGAE
jgi:hypothetical protein